MTTTPHRLPLLSPPARRILWTGILTIVLAGLTGLALRVQGMGALDLTLAAVATAVSFWALGQYDVIWHRISGVRVLPGQAQATGMAAVAIGQTLGACSLTSALVRRLALRDLAHGDIARISAGVALSFSACWSFMALIALHLMGPTQWFQSPPLIVIVALTLGILYALVRLSRQDKVRLPDALAMMAYTMLDLTASALALYVLMPATLDISFAAFWAVFVLAIGAGILSNLPGGIGVFEAVLIACLPAHDIAPLIAAIVAFRVIYYLVPFGIAAVWLKRRRQAVNEPRVMADLPPSAPAGWGLADQTGTILSTQRGAIHVAQVPFGLVALGDPAGARDDRLPTLAAASGRWGAIYKCSARLATHLRGLGWTTALIARDAVINPQDWSTAGSARQTLRRKLRHAAQADVQVIYATRPLPLSEMSAIAADWARRHGGEMGFSMGRFDPAYVQRQEVFLIFRGETLCGFVTFHRGPHDWELDLMRHSADLPDGAMHQAICSAIAAARATGVTRLSLAAVPVSEGPFARAFHRRQGLCQFKRSFAPRWEPLYHAAPSPTAFWVTGAAITWRIQRPLARWLARSVGPVWELCSGPLHATSRTTRPGDDCPADVDTQSARPPHDEPPVPAT